LLRGIFISRRSQLFISRRKAFVFDLSQISLISQIFVKHLISAVEYLRHLRYLRATHISACINYLSQISQILVSVVYKNLKNPSSDVLALRASLPLSWLCACEQAPAPATTSPHIAPQRRTSSEEKQ
jgi:hypothetical protein